METVLNDIPEDMEALRAAFLAMRSKAAALEIDNARLAAENTFLDTLNQKLAHYVAKLKRLTFGQSSEKRIRHERPTVQKAVVTSLRSTFCISSPEPQGHGSFRPILDDARDGGGVGCLMG